MLLQFKVKNFRCFYDESILDLTATPEKQHIEETILINKNRVLPLVEINGANASGKTTILDAINFMFLNIKYSNKNDINKNLKFMPFLFSEKSRNQNSEFEISICLDNYEYRYGFAMNKNEYAEEWLYRRKFSNKNTIEKVIFERYNGKVEFGPSYNNYEKIWNLFSNSIDTSKLLILSTIALRDEKGIIRNIYNYISKFHFQVESSLESEFSIEILNKNNLLFQKFQKIITEFDPCLLGIQIEKLDNDNNDNEYAYTIKGIHKSIDNNKLNLIPFSEESNGTIKMFNIMPSILKNLEFGGLLAIDEIDIKLHPLLFKKIITMYKDKNINKNNAQLIYTAHSTYLLNSDYLRKDEIYLVEKNLEGKASLYSLSEFRKLRIDSNYEKKYLTGQFGAIPNFDLKQQ